MPAALSAAGLLLAISGCAHSPSYDPEDPLEKVNRRIFAVNLKADQYLLRPVATSYVRVLPDSARLAVRNFFENFLYPTTIANDFLQGKLEQGGEDSLRFALNSTIGLAGFLDVATGQGFERHDEDLGQTFGKWGFGQGWYLMLPLLGPTTNRDLVGRIGDSWTETLQYVSPVTTLDRLGFYSAQQIDHRGRLLKTDHVMHEQLDPYVFVRTAYLDYRQNLVFDGNPPDDISTVDEPQ
ncbi:VacJ family lipoprotein [Hydrocarboniphaga sp.]|uniref:MlaA family lipoprotein n=1 Tax=Hydrocarboniphaga sp. TaxID=2033016 RepID=UPI00262217F5|nr:VacJ family lipoprotein [Hydrocarboniphaga sp.]